MLLTAAPDSLFLSTHFTATTSLGPFCSKKTHSDLNLEMMQAK
jgi:hypothetical protein